MDSKEIFEKNVLAKVNTFVDTNADYECQKSAIRAVINNNIGFMLKDKKFNDQITKSKVISIEQEFGRLKKEKEEADAKYKAAKAVNAIFTAKLLEEDNDLDITFIEEIESQDLKSQEAKKSEEPKFQEKKTQEVKIEMKPKKIKIEKQG